MKKIILLLVTISIFRSHQAIGQQTINEIVACCKELPESFSAVYDLNVVQYFELENTYNTELKKLAFKKTQEYQELLSKLKLIKSEIQNSIYYTKVTNPFVDQDYDVKQHGFKYALGGNEGIAAFTRMKQPKSIIANNSDVISINSIPSHKNTAHARSTPGCYEEELLFRVNENDGLEIENNKEDVDLFFFFSPSGKENYSFKFLDVKGPKPFWINETTSEIKSDWVRIVIANRKSGRIFYDKIYPENKSEDIFVKAMDNAEQSKDDRNQTTINTLEIDTNKIYTWVDQMPTPSFDFSGYVSENIRYPVLAREKRISGRVIVKFVVNRDGTISDVHVPNGIGGGCDEEAIRLISSMPKWIAGKQNNVPVKVLYTSSLSFMLE